MATPIRLPPSTGTTGTNAAFQPNKPTTAAVEPVKAPPDGFSAELGQPQAQLTGRVSMRAPGQLASDLKQLKDPSKLSERLAADLKVHLPELVALLNLTREQKASRLVEFLVPYASKLAELKTQLPPAHQAKLAAAMLEPMKAAGLVHVVETTTGKSGVEVAKQLLAAPSPQAVRAMTEGLKFDAPNWAGTPEAAAAAAIAGKPLDPQLIAQVQPPREQRTETQPAGDADKGRREKGRSGVLGKNMFFNVLHLFRDDAATLTEKEKLEAGIVTVGLISLAIAIAVAVTFAVSG